MILLIRHASACDRDAWTDEDALRPLDERGIRQAGKLVERLASFPLEAILSSPAVRCRQTVEPLARARGLEIEERDELGEVRQWVEGHELVRALAGSAVAICGHGGLEQALPEPPRFRKGSVLVVDPALAVVDVLGRA